jgi:medium-chain acyl-[acyl-carrier-protein] hydrolase
MPSDMSAPASVLSQASAWIEYSTPNPAAGCRLFCFPYAGGSASIYRQWNGSPFDAVEICPIQIPGRENRTSEKPFTKLLPLAKALADVFPLDRPFAFFGHSAGALLCFEIARELRRRGEPLPFHLFASGCSAPQLCPSRPPRFNLKRDELITEMRKLGGTPEEVLNNDELLDFVLPALRADFALLDTYIYRDEKAFDFTITALSGQADLEVDHWEVVQWSTQTDQQFRHRQFPGGHFFLHEEGEDVKALVAREIDRTLRTQKFTHN